MNSCYNMYNDTVLHTIAQILVFLYMQNKGKPNTDIKVDDRWASMQKYLFSRFGSNKVTDQPAHLQSDQRICYSLFGKIHI